MVLSRKIRGQHLSPTPGKTVFFAPRLTPEDAPTKLKYTLRAPRTMRRLGLWYTNYKYA